MTRDFQKKQFIDWKTKEDDGNVWEGEFLHCLLAFRDTFCDYLYINHLKKKNESLNNLPSLLRRSKSKK